MADNDQLGFIIRVQDDGTAKVENFYGNLQKGLAQIPSMTAPAKTAMKQLGDEADNTAAKLPKTGKAAQDTGKKVAEMTISVWGAISAFRMVKGVVQDNLREYAKYEDSMNRLKANTLTATGAMSSSFRQMTDAAFEMSTKTRYSATQIQEAMAFMAQAGVKDIDIIKNIAPVADLATNELLNLEDAARIALQVMTSVGDDIPMNRVLDTLVTASVSSAASLVDLGESWKMFGDLTKQSGMTLEETAAVLGVLADGGIKATMAGTTLRSAILRLTDPVGRAKESLQQLGLMTEDGTKKYTNFLDVLGKLQNVQDAEVHIKRIFGTTATAGLNSMLSRMEKLVEMFEKVKEAAGNNSDMAKIKTEGLAGSMDILGNSLSNVKVAIEGIMAPFLNPGFLKIAELMNAWARMMRGAANSPVVSKSASFAGNAVSELFSFGEGFGELVNQGPLWGGSGSGEIDSTLTDIIRERRQKYGQGGMLNPLNLKRGVPGLGTAFSYKDLVEGGLPNFDRTNYVESLPVNAESESAVVSAFNSVYGNTRSGHLESFMDFKGKDKVSKASASNSSLSEARENEANIAKALVEMKQENDEIMEAMASIKGSDFESTVIEDLQGNMDHINEIFYDAANTREKILFDSNTRSAQHILSLTKNYQDAAKKQVGVEQAKKSAMIGIAGETASALFNTFVHGEEGRFKVAKNIAIAESLVNTYQAATAALKLGPGIGYIAAAAITVAGLARVNQIRQTEIGSGDAAASMPGGGFDVPEAPPSSRSFESSEGSGSPGSNDVIVGRGGRNVIFNITVDGFVGSESELASKLAEVIREGSNDNLDFGLTVSRG